MKKSIMTIILATMSVSASFANTLIFHVTKNDIDDYGEESIQMQTQEGDLIIYAVNLTDGQGQTLVQAEAGTCLAISSPTEITKNDGYYVIDQIDNVVSGPCNESVTDVGTGCLLYNDRICRSSTTLSDLPSIRLAVFPFLSFHIF